MRRRRKNQDLPKIIALSAVLAVCTGAMGYAALSTFGQPTPDQYGCFEEVKQRNTFVLFDASEPRLNTEQHRSVRHYLDELDEATNYKINELESLLTWGRSYGIRLHLIFQDFAAFERTYGKTALDTLLSETEIKQFLPGQRSPKTLEIISKQMLGEQSVLAMGANRSIEHLGLNETISEVGRPLATPDEIRRMKEGILFVRQYSPILFEPISYAEIEPFRSEVGINPFHGKPFRKKVKLRL